MPIAVGPASAGDVDAAARPAPALPAQRGAPRHPLPALPHRPLTASPAPGGRVSCASRRPPTRRHRSPHREVTDMKARLVALIAAPVALAVPASAGAAGIAVSSACPVAGAKVGLSGSGFTPGATVAVRRRRVGQHRRGRGRQHRRDVHGRARHDGLAAGVPGHRHRRREPRGRRGGAVPRDPRLAAHERAARRRAARQDDLGLRRLPRRDRDLRPLPLRRPDGEELPLREAGRPVRDADRPRPPRAGARPRCCTRGTWTLQLDQRRHYRTSGPKRVIPFRMFRTLL